ncbi:uncharacterized protein LOC113127701 isoform X2 [Mastacembelus armatus]|uniref:uncharacterized protein LOC113127701 isoform X2 n=1 Tax=Mastacembelus armatus TaxID=205130 RepID=UPI000E45C7D4|nr:uncharacterized protein LOC113127701 isoform X2 [Mastacembelus armatus]
MQVVCKGRTFWTYTLLFASLQLLGRLSAFSTSCTLPAPTLNTRMRSRDSVVLICQAPKDHQGVVFMLYRFREKVDSKDLQSSGEQVQFTVKVKEEDSGQGELFCCLYKNHEGCYSAFSPYLKLQHQTDAAPNHSILSFPLPILSMEPSNGLVKRGDMLSFSCSVPSPPSHSEYNTTPQTFLLLRTAGQTGEASVIYQLEASLVSSPRPQPAVFTLGPVRGGEEGEYICLYQIKRETQLVNSTISNVVQVSITEMLPLPTLVLQQQTDLWHLLCTGSPAYPSAVFSLYLVGNEHPVATHHAKVFHHQATFPVPVLETHVALYQCQYSVLLGKNWSTSERSHPLNITRGIHPPSSPGLTNVDWPLVLGSFSAGVLFICSAALIVVVAQRKVKSAAEKKKKREEAQFWTKVRAKDHVVDLTLKHSSFNSQEWDSGDPETAPGSQIWTSLSTFTSPVF